MQLADLNAVNFAENAMEFGLLDDEGKAAITARLAELVAQKYPEVLNDGSGLLSSLLYSSPEPFHHLFSTSPLQGFGWYV